MQTNFYAIDSQQQFTKQKSDQLYLTQVSKCFPASLFHSKHIDHAVEI